MNNSKKISSLFVLILSLIVFSLSYLNYWTGDNISLKYIAGSYEQIRTITDALVSQVYRYFHNDGRLFAHFLIQIYVGIFGKLAFSITNVIVFGVLVSQIIRLGNTAFRYSKSVLCIILLLLYTYIIHYAPTFIIQYIWIPTFVLLWINLLFNSSNNHNWLINILLIVFSLLCGQGHEGISVGVSFALVSYVLRNYRNLSKIQYLMILGFWIGTLFCCLSPASISRSHLGSWSLTSKLQGFFYSLVLFRALYVLVVYVAYLIITKKCDIKSIYKNNSFYFDALLSLLAFNIFIGVYCNRQLLGLELMSIIIIVRLLDYKRLFDNVILVLLSIIVVGSYIFFYNVLFKRIGIYEDLMKLYDNGNTEVVYYDLKSDAMWPENSLSDYFNDWAFRTITYGTYSSRQCDVYDLKVVPTFVKNNNDYTNRYIEFDKKSLVVVTSKSHPPKNVVIDRCINLGIFSINYKSMNVSFNNPVYEDDNIRVYVIYQSYSPMPFVEQRAVHIIE